MRVSFLGTGTSTGVPVINCRCRVCTSTDPKNKRMRQSVRIEANGKHFLIDTVTGHAASADAAANVGAARLRTPVGN